MYISLRTTYLSMRNFCTSGTEKVGEEGGSIDMGSTSENNYGCLPIQHNYNYRYAG